MFQRLYFQKLLLQRFFLLLLVYTLCRFVFVVFNSSFYQYGFSEIAYAFFVALLFDSSAIIYTNSLFILFHVLPFKYRENGTYKSILKWFFYGVNSIAILLNLIDTAYYKFSGKRSGLELLQMRGELSDVWKNYILDYWYIIAVFILLISVLVSGYQLINKKNKAVKLIYNRKQYLAEGIAFLCISIITFLGARGGINLIPISTFDAARISRAELVPLIVNTPFQFIVSTQQAGLTPQNYIDINTANKYYNPIKIASNSNTIFNKPNIVIIIMESLGKEYVGYYNKGKGYTPFIDSLMQHSLVFNHAYANGKRSIEGIPAIVASLPTWMNNDYPNSLYQSNQLNSIGAYLHQLGYQTSFYHGGKNGTMSFDNFAAITNCGKYYGLNEYPNKDDFDQHWGIYDEPYLHYFGKQLSTYKQPFFSTVFTLSSHHPYSLPKHLQNKFSAGTLPIHKTIKYSDYALQQFFYSYKNEPWFNNTIFIITADHSAENETNYYQTEQGKYEIPLMVYSSNKNWVSPIINESTIQQIDILPMALKYANYKNTFYSFGEQAGFNHWAMQLNGGLYQFISWPYVYQFDGKFGIAFFNLTKDSLMRKNEINNQLYKPEINKIDSTTKCIIQRYNHDLIYNKTTQK